MYSKAIKQRKAIFKSKQILELKLDVDKFLRCGMNFYWNKVQFFTFSDKKVKVTSYILTCYLGCFLDSFTFVKNDVDGSMMKKSDKLHPCEK